MAYRVANIGATGANGKNDKYVMNNSTFRYGVTLGNLADIAACMKGYVIPNNYKGLVIGIGFPDSPVFFPEFDKRMSRDRDSAKIYRCMRQRKPELTYFQRLYMLEKALRGDAPLGKALQKLNDDHIGFEPVPSGKVFIVPKHPHQIYAGRYDNFCIKNRQGQLEPRKELIQLEYLFSRESGGSDGDGRDRIKAKDASDRNIDLAVLYEHELPKDAVKARKINVFSSQQQKEISQSIEENEFELGVMPYAILNNDQMAMIDETLDAAYTEPGRKEVVFAVPYSPVPKSESGRRKFWKRFTESDFKSPFERYEELKDHIETLFEDNPDELGRIHFTFVEMNRYDKFSDEKKSLSYLPPHYRPHGVSIDYLSELQRKRKSTTRSEPKIPIKAIPESKTTASITSTNSLVKMK